MSDIEMKTPEERAIQRSNKVKKILFDKNGKQIEKPLNVFSKKAKRNRKKRYKSKVPF